MDVDLPEDAFICTELTPWQTGLTDAGTMVVHAEAEAVTARRWLAWGRFAQQKRCPVCGTTWMVRE